MNYVAYADAADRLAAEIVADGGRAISAIADVAETAAIDAVVVRIEKELGPLTILVNNAGVSWRGTLDSYHSEQVARMRRVNVEGLIHATRAVIGGMRARRYGRINQHQLNRRNRHGLAWKRVLRGDQSRGCDFDQTLRTRPR